MRVRKEYRRTFETMGVVVFADGRAYDAFISMLQGHLATLRVGRTQEDVREDRNCTTYHLYQESGRKQLKKDGIIAVNYATPTTIAV